MKFPARYVSGSFPFEPPSLFQFFCSPLSTFYKLLSTRFSPFYTSYFTGETPPHLALFPFNHLLVTCSSFPVLRLRIFPLSLPHNLSSLLFLILFKHLAISSSHGTMSDEGILQNPRKKIQLFTTLQPVPFY